MIEVESGGRTVFAVEMTDMSGWQQTPREIRVPLPMEIAIISGRICRYAGNLPCSLLTHVMVGAYVVWDLLRTRVCFSVERTFGWWMLHDAHETITGDFASHKCKEMKAWQEKIDDAIAAVYGIGLKDVDLEVIDEADLMSRWLEAKHYGSDRYMEAFEKTNTYAVPSPEMKTKTSGIFRSDLGRMSCCVVDSNESASASGPVMIYASILDRILDESLEKAMELYSDMVVGLEV